MEDMLLKILIEIES